MAEQEISLLSPDASEEVFFDEEAFNDALEKNPLRQVVLSLHKDAIEQLKKQSFSELSELKDRQKEVRDLNEALKEMHKNTEKNGSVKITEELRQLLDKIKEHKIDIPAKQNSLTKEEKERLIERINLTISDLKILNDMQLQKIHQLTNERYEIYHMTRSIMKTIHETERKFISEIKTH